LSSCLTLPAATVPIGDATAALTIPDEDSGGRKTGPAELHSSPSGDAQIAG
jgi:hypothetical protein